MPIKWLSKQKCLKLLEKAVYGRLATCGNNNQPYITPLNFVFTNGRIYFHCGFEGQKIDNINSNPRVCFEVSRHGKLYAAPLAKNFSMRYWSILVFGKAAQVNDEKRKLFVMNKLMKKYAPGYEYAPLSLADMKTCNLIEITIYEVTGKVSVDPGKRGA
jgi:nitroimidazol reductase NimA-like FMN-containing flavoprotein (pyridoxamine 5'-phosphate oxidase superfamily)